MTPEELPEPWLRGPIEGVGPILMPVLHALAQAREDLHRGASGLGEEQIWSRPGGLTPLGFHLRHIAGSLDRLTAYLRGRQLTPDQMAFLRAESVPGAGGPELLREIDEAIDRTAHAIRGIDPGTLAEPRFVGRKRLPTSVIGLAIHLAEHTQRHVGQAITTCLLLRGS